ncbi:MAG TPA: hypothetical protein VF859_04705 [Burkholderiales bacterium]
MRRRVPGLALALTLALGGCAQFKFPFPPAAEPAPGARPEAPPEPAGKLGLLPASDLDRAVAYYDHLRRAKPADLTKEQEAARQAFGSSKSDLNRLRYATAQSMPGAPGRNDEAAQALLDPLLKDESRDPGLRAFAHLLNASIAERRRYEERLREDQKQIEEQQRKLDDLQKKLDALTAIEKSLMDRGRKPAPTEKR